MALESSTVIEGPMPRDIGVPPRPGELRFLDSDPHVAFFAIDPDRGLIQQPDACLRWGVMGSRWWALDPWGAVVGEYELHGGHGYPVTNCYELEMTRVTGDYGTGLLVTGPYREPESARWQPSEQDLARLQARVTAIDAVFASPRGEPPAALSERMIAYRRADGTREGYSRDWVAVGGRWLGLFSLEAGDWQLRQFDAQLATDPYLPADAQMPIAAIDLDGDGDPELIVHEHVTAAWNDVLLRPAGSTYERGFESPGGATI
jgi:hypothetical protein